MCPLRQIYDKKSCVTLTSTMLMTIGLVNGRLVLTHLSFLPCDVITVGMRGEPNFLRFLTKNTHAYKIQHFHTIIA